MDRKNPKKVGEERDKSIAPLTREIWEKHKSNGNNLVTPSKLKPKIKKSV